MIQVFGSGGIFAFVEFKKAIIQMIDPFLDHFSINFLSYLLESLRIRDLGEGAQLFLYRLYVGGTVMPMCWT